MPCPPSKSSISTSSSAAARADARRRRPPPWRAGFIAQGFLLVVSGVYYPVEVMPGWMQALATISPATYALEGIRSAVLDGAGLGAVWGDLWPLLVIGAVSVPLGLAVFRAGERYAKRHGKLKRSG